MATTENILATLATITYSQTSHTVERRFQLHDTEYEDFTDFPLIVVVSGNEEIDNNANSMADSIFHPVVHFFIEGATAATMETWRENIRNAIMQSATLWSYSLQVMITAITVDEPENRKLQHIQFDLEVVFEKSYTIA